MEFDFHANLDIHGFAILKSRLKAPLADGFERLCVESQTQAANHFNIARTSGCIDDQPKHASSLLLGSARFFCIVRIRGRNGLRRRDATTNFVNSASDAAAAPGTHTGTVTDSHSASGT